MKSRYSGNSRINLGTQLGTPQNVLLFKKAIKDGRISVVKQVIATGSDRLDTLAGDFYNDSRYWWVLAIASGIGWGLQIPPGTVINVVSLDDALRFIG